MKCIVCGMDTAELAECPRCGFEVPEVIGEWTPELKEINEGYAERYRNLRLGDIRLGVTVYEWKLDSESETVEKTGESVAWFEPWKQLPTDEIRWLPDSYRSAKTADEVELTIHVKIPGRREIVQGMKFSTAGRGDVWQLGVRGEKNGDLFFVLGTPGQYNRSVTRNLFELLKTAEKE